MLPPMRCISPYATDSTSPVSGDSLLEKNGSNTRERFSSGIPGPWSAIATTTPPRPSLAPTSTVPPTGVEPRALASRSAKRCDSSAAVPRTSGSGGTSSSMRSPASVPSSSVRAISSTPRRTALRSTPSAGWSRRRRARSCSLATVAAAPSTTRPIPSRLRWASPKRGSARSAAMRSAITLSEWFRSWASPEATTPMACMRSSWRRASRSRSRWASLRTCSEMSWPSTTTDGPVAVGRRSSLSSKAQSPRSKRQVRTAPPVRSRSKASAQARCRSDGYRSAACPPRLQRHSPLRWSSARKSAFVRLTRSPRTSPTALFALRPSHRSRATSSLAPRLCRACTTLASSASSPLAREQLLRNVAHRAAGKNPCATDFLEGLGSSQVAPHAGGRIVARRADHRAGGVASGAGRVEPLHGRRVGKAVRETERVVHVVDVPARDAEMPLDLRRRERERVHHQVAGARGEAVAEREQMPHVTLLFGLPGGPPQGVRHPLHEQRRIVPPLGVAQRGVDRGVDVPLDGRELRQPPRLHVGERRAHRGHHLRLVGQQVHGRAELPAIGREAGEARQIAQRQVHLERGSVPQVPVDAGVVRRRQAVASDQLPHPEGIGVHHHGARADLAAVLELHAVRGAPLDRDPAHRAARLDA